MLKLKLFLLGLVISFFGIIGFSNANFINYGQYVLDYNQSQYPFWLDDSTINFQQDGYLCVDYFLNSSVENGIYLNLTQSGNPDTTYQYYYISDRMGLLCLEISSEYSEFGTVGIELYDYSPTGYAGVYFFPAGDCPVIDTNYCVENDLCPVSSGSWSELVINNIVHEGKPLINLNIPDYIHWDYSVDENQYDIYVGSGYDQDYIDSVLKINSYRPDSADFTDTFVSGLTLIFPYIFVALLIVFIWKLLKRIFK